MARVYTCGMNGISLFSGGRLARAGVAVLAAGIAQALWGGPLRLVVNPYEKGDWSRMSQYKANLHTHTVESGGKLFLSELFSEYAQKGYAILAITDHDHCTRWQKEGLDPLKQYGILPVRGQEYSRGHHVNGLFLDRKSVLRETGPLVEEIASRGGWPVVNHPSRYWKPQADGAMPQAVKDGYLELVREYPSVGGIEVFNTNSGGESDTALWDVVLEASMPGHPVWGYANDDTHEREHIGQSWETFLMGDLTEASLRSALSQGCFYLSVRRRRGDKDAYPPVIQSVAHDPVAQTITVRAAADGGLLADEKVRWISNGAVVHTGPVLAYGRTPGIGTYVRVEMTGEGGDSYTNPFGFSRAEP